MSEEQSGEYQTESQSTEESQSGSVGRVFLSLLILALAATTAVFAYMKEDKFFQDLLAQDEWNAQLIGNLHPVLMLLPIGLIFMVVLLDVLGWLSFGRWKPATVSALFFVVLTTVLASLSGLVLMELEGNTGTEWNLYMWYGVGATVLFALSFISKIWGKDGNGRGIIYAVFLLGGAATLGYGAYTHGQNVHAFTLIPAEKELTTPFGNQIIKEQMSASMMELEASNAGLDNEITQIISTLKTTEGKYRDEQKNLVAAEKSIGELKQNVVAAQKKATETQKKADETVKTLEGKVAETQKQVEMGNAEKSNLQKEVDDLKSQIEALKKAKEETTEEEKPSE